MTTERGRTFLTLLREATAVLAAILIAFALDAWWDARVERSDALFLLEAVDERMAVDIANIDSVNAVNREVVAAISRLAVVPPAEIESMPIDDLFARFGRFGDLQTLNPELGAVQALIGGDVLGGLRSQELRSALTSVPALWDEAMEEGEVVEQNGFMAAVRMFELSDMRRTAPMMLDAVPSPEGFREVLRSIVATDESRAYWLAIGTFTLQYIDELETLQARLIEIRDMIAAELR